MVYWLIAGFGVVTMDCIAGVGVVSVDVSEGVPSRLLYPRELGLSMGTRVTHRVLVEYKASMWYNSI